MINHRPTSTLRTASNVFTTGFVVVVSLFALAAETARAQQTVPAGAPPVGQRDPFAEIRERQQREAQLRSTEMLGASKSPGARGSEAAVEQLKEDFRSIQVLRNKLVRHLQSDQPRDYKFIADEAEEINRRAGRLKTQLLRVAPGSEKKEPEKPSEIADAQMTDALVKMCRRIDSFTESPVFKVPDVVNVEQSARVGSDLRDIIQLSEGIRKTAERLRKTQRK